MASANGYFSTPSFVNNLIEKLEDLTPLSSDCCIYRVPNRLREANEKTYTPQIVSIGPVHHGKEGLERMEEHKKRYLKSFLGHTRHTRVLLENYVAVVKEKEKEIRHCYADSIDFGSEKFVEIILVDAGFVIELFLRFLNQDFRDDVDRIYEKPLMMRHIVPDLQLLENQLPFFILDDFFETAKRVGFVGHHVDKSLIQIADMFFKSQLLVKQNSKTIEVFSPKVLHFVDLLWKFYKPEETKRGKLNSITVPTITELHQAGVKLKEGDSTDQFNITFKNGVLTIPPIQLLDRSEIVFRNLIAFEECHCPKDQHYLTNYFVFMERLVDSPEDLKLLVKYGIIQHSMGDSAESSSVLKKLVDGVVVDINNFHYASVCAEINDYCRIPWNKWKANLKQKYFNTPWAVISVLGAIVLLVLSFIQTFCSAYSCHK